MNRPQQQQTWWMMALYAALLFGVLLFWGRMARRIGGVKDEDAVEAPVSSPPAAAVLPGETASALGVGEQRAIAIFNRVSRSVVSVANRALVRDFFGFQVYEVPRGAGSGFIWDRKGHLVSNFHVIYEASAVTVTLRDGSSYEARVVGVDPDHDLAVLRIDAPAEVLAPIETGVSRDLQVGQSVLAIGNPFGLDTSLSVGVVSALGRSITSMTQRRIHDVIQTDAAINPGNSGGPLLDSSGRLVGVNTAILSPSGAYAGIGFAVPVDTVRRVVPQLIRHGKVRRVGLGIQMLPDHLARRAGIEGVAVLRALDGGAAAEAGIEGARQRRDGRLELGDVIVEADGEAVRGPDDLSAILDRHAAGDRVPLTCMRDGRKRRLQVRLQVLD
jgi:S1-C subfamily serine protease